MYSHIPRNKMKNIPNEILVHILSFLPWSDLLISRLVCKNWNININKKTLRFLPCPGEIDKCMRCLKNLKSLQIANIDIDGQSLLTGIKTSKFKGTLRELDLSRCGLNSQTLGQIIDILPTLQNWYFIIVPWITQFWTRFVLNWRNLKY